MTVQLKYSSYAERYPLGHLEPYDFQTPLVTTVMAFLKTLLLNQHGDCETVRCGEAVAVDGFPRQRVAGVPPVVATAAGISKLLNPKGGSPRYRNCRGWTSAAGRTSPLGTRASGAIIFL